MGYKTTDNAEKEKLEKEGHKVIALKGIPYSGPEYEFDFDVPVKSEAPKEAIKEVIEKVEKEVEVPKKEIKEQPKRKGNPQWFGGKKK
jgi:hypothetical protein